jgi:hypothetical protein
MPFKKNPHCNIFKTWKSIIEISKFKRAFRKNIILLDLEKLNLKNYLFTIFTFFERKSFTK